METINYLLMDFDSDELSPDDIERLMKIRVSTLPDNERKEVGNTLVAIENRLGDLISIGSPIYEAMGDLPSVYLSTDADSVATIMIKIGKTIHNVRILQSCLD
jgi:hypothetical protein